MSGNVQLAMSHVVPDLIQKVLKGQDPLHILGDGGRCAITPMAPTWPAASGCASSGPKPSTRISTSAPAESTTVLELAEMIWDKIAARRAIPLTSAIRLTLMTCRSACPTS